MEIQECLGLRRTGTVNGASVLSSLGLWVLIPLAAFTSVLSLISLQTSMVSQHKVAASPTLSRLTSD